MHIHLSEPLPDVVHVVRDCRGDVLGELDSPSAPTGLYPDVILHMAARLNDDKTSTADQFYNLWELILMHWFPQSEGYTIHPRWPIPYSDDLDRVTFAVLLGSVPIALLDVSPPRGFDNPHSRAFAEEFSTEHFEQIAPYFDYPLCAIAAMGKKWTAFQAFSTLTPREARALGEERIEWMDDIVSEPSYEMLDRFVALLKERIRISSTTY